MAVRSLRYGHWYLILRSRYGYTDTGRKQPPMWLEQLTATLTCECQRYRCLAHITRNTWLRLETTFFGCVDLTLCYHFARKPQKHHQEMLQ